MSILESVTNDFVARSWEILGDNLVGIYLHGSAVMGCFNPKKSDIDLLVVVNDDVPAVTKRRFMDMVVELNGHAPEKGIEMSVVRKDVCKPFVYPTPYELHFSQAHLEWYKTNPDDYIARMNGVDKDLAAHFTITYHRGKCLCGKEIREVFDKVGAEYYFDSILYDIENAENEITANPTYIILNLCRVLAYKVDSLILSKKEGGSWGLENLPKKYHGLISDAMQEYSSEKSPEWDEDSMRDFAAYMIGRIKG